VAHDSGSPVARRPQDRLDDHAAIDRLTDELLPALVAKLGANGLGELEVREGTWRVRLRMPADGHAAGARRSPSGRQGARAADGSRGEHSRTDAAGTAGSAGTGHATAASGHAPEDATAAGPSRVVATSPAVGYFRPRADLRAGTKVRAGDRIGSVDVLGIGQDLVAPGDGLIGATLVEASEPVEYGQAVIVLEQLAEPRPHAASATAAQSGPAESGPADGAPAAAGAGHDGAPATGVA
jgi:acetyl-CoA carboxylase biotin carboxyl carrier protein